MRFAKLFTCFLLASAVTFPAFSQPEKQNPEIARLLKEDLTRAGVQMNSYEFGPIHDTKAPKGYKPFYISHYGRHGSRSNWGGPNYQAVADILTQAKEKGLLTSTGDSLLERTNEVIRIHNGMNGRLTRIGCEEHQKLAERMYGRYKKVFKRKGTSIRAISSTVPRCIVSMAAFTSKLSAINPRFDISWDTGETYMAYLSNDPSAEQWKGVNALLDSLNASYHVDTVLIMKRLFTDPVAAKGLVGDVETFERNIYETGVVDDPFELRPLTLSLLPFDAVYKWYEHAAMHMYLGQCNSKEFGAMRMPRIEPLVNEIVAKADEAIGGGKVAVDLRFGHDYPTLALASYIGIEGVGDRMSFEEARQKWFGGFNVPFAVNIQMIFYRNKQDDVLVKFLYNEKETRLRGLEPFEGPYYKWDVVKANIKGYLR